MKTLDIQNEQVIIDAVKLLKSDFTTLYVKMGYDHNQTALDWHRIRISPKGRKMIEELYSGKRHIQALSQISDFEEEAAERSDGEKKKKKTKSTEEVTETKSTPIVESDRGQKTAIAKQLITEGKLTAKEISEKSGAALAYVRTLMYNAKKKK